MDEFQLTESTLVVGPGYGKPPIATKASISMMVVAKKQVKRRAHTVTFFISWAEKETNNLMVR